MPKIGHKLKSIRQSRGMNQGDFGALFDMSRPTYTLIEKNEKEVDDGLLYKMSKVLELAPEELLDSVDLKIIRKPVHTSVSKSVNLIPFWDAIAVGGFRLEADQTPINGHTEMIDPGTWLRKATGSLRVYGHSMFPKYPAGCIVAFKEADQEVIIWGEDYVIELEERRIIKRLEKGDNKDFVKAVSYNKSEEYAYAPVDIPRTKIKRLFMVLGKVELEASL